MSSVDFEQSQGGKELIIKIKGRFDFSQHQSFRGAYEAADDAVSGETKVERFVVDLQEANYIDSSALGMLLLLRDHAGGERGEVKLINCSNDVRKILAISNFEKLFQIE